MIIKYRTEPRELQLLRSLHVRMELSEKDKQNFIFLERGYQGEKKFDQLVTDLDDCLIFQDLLLECKNTLFQIDTLIIHPENVFLLDVKNYEGVFYIEEERWYRQNATEYKDPLMQLHRCEALFRQWLQQIQLNFVIESRLIFIHSEFTLFQASKDLPVILPTQINHFLRRLNKSRSKLTKKHERLSEMLLANYKDEFPYSNLPEYQLERLQKGVLCQQCHSFMSPFNKSKLICSSCNVIESIEDCIVRSVAEYKLLFPDRKVTVPAIKDWCLVIKSEKLIRRILMKNYKKMGEHRFTYYEEK